MEHAPGSEVWGAVYACTPEAMEKLDDVEGVPGGRYLRYQVEVEFCERILANATTYIAGSAFICSQGQPQTDYLEHITEGARKHGLNEEYVENIRNQALKTN